MRFAILVLGIAISARADNLAAARDHYARANTAYDLQQFAEAAHEYEEAFRLKPDPVLLFNIGQAYRNAKEYEKAIGAYRSFVRRLPASPHRAEVEERINDLRALIEAQKRERERPPAGPAAVELPEATAPSPAPVVLPPEPPPPIRSDGGSRKLRIAGVAVAAVGLGLIAAGAGVEALRQSDSDALAHPAPGTPYRTELAGAVDRDVALEATLFAAGGAAVVAGTVTALLGLRRVTVIPSLTTNRASLSLGMEF